MKVLLVSNQLVEKKDGSFFCIENFFDIVKNFSVLGELLLCACKYEGKSSNIIDKKITDLIKPNNIHLINKTIVKTDVESRDIIEKQVSLADLVIGYLPSTNASTAWFFARKYNKKFLSYVVGCPWDSLWNHGICGKILAPRAYLNLRKVLRQSDYALYVTDHFLQKRYPCPGITCGCSDVRIVNLDDEILTNRLKRIENKSENGIFKIATIANYQVRYKGQHYVIRAIARLKKMGISRFHYYLIGGGNKKYLENLSRKLGVSDLVHFEGIVPHNKIFDKLDEMDVYIQPSLQEGLPRSVVEAMSRGLLCICANTAAMPEMVDSEYVVNRKSVGDIVNILTNISEEKLKAQAVRNFEEAKKYEEHFLGQKRNDFFKKITV